MDIIERNDPHGELNKNIGVKLIDDYDLNSNRRLIGGDS